MNCDSVSHGSCAEVIAMGAAITAGECEFDTIVAVLGGEHERMLPYSRLFIMQGEPRFPAPPALMSLFNFVNIFFINSLIFHSIYNII